MVVRARNDELIGLDILVEDELPRVGTLNPQVLGRLASQDIANFRSDDVRQPVHGLLRVALIPDIWRPARGRQAADLPYLGVKIRLFRGLSGASDTLRQ